MLKDVWVLLTTKWDFFGKLLLEHIEISLAAILIAIVMTTLWQIWGMVKGYILKTMCLNYLHTPIVCAI